MAKPWEKYQNGQGQVFTLPPDPRQTAKDGRDERRMDIIEMKAAQAEQARLKEAENSRIKLEAELATKGLMLGPDGIVTQRPGGALTPAGAQGSRPDLTSKEYTLNIETFRGAEEAEQRLNRLREIYAEGPGGTTGLRGLYDWLPNRLTPSNQNFDKAGGRFRSDMKQATGTTGGENNTLAEMRFNLGKYIPESGEFDSVNRDTFAAMQGIIENAKRTAITSLGGIPDANGRVTALTPEQLAARVWESTYSVDAERKAGDTFAEDTLEKMPPAMAAEYEAYIGRNAGNIDPQAYGAFVVDLSRRYGFNPPPTMEAEQSAYGRTMNDAYGKGQRTFETPGVQRKMSGGEQFKNAIVNNPLGAAVTGSLDGLTGLPSALAPDAVDALTGKSGWNQGAYLAGQIGGGIAATKGIGAVGGRIAARMGPLGQRLLGNGARSGYATSGQAGRNLATDTAYGAGIGAVQGDPVGGAVFGALGSGAGQAGAGAVGAGIGGLRRSSLARSLEGQGIPLTIGQTIGGFPRRLENAATGLPIIGDMIQRRQGDAFKAFDEAAFQQGGRPIGANIRGTGDPALGRFESGINTAYDDATAGVTVPLDDVFRDDMGAVAATGSHLPEDYLRTFDEVGRGRIGPALEAGSLTGEGYQQATRGLKSAKAKADGVGQSGYEKEYRDVLSMAQAALRGQMVRGGGERVVKGLDKADEAYRNFKILADAVKRARNGTRGGDVDIFAPSQLIDAESAAKKYGGSPDLRRLAKVGQKVLPSNVPNSGTGERLLVNAAGVGSLTGAGYLAGVDPASENVQNGALGTALLATLGTRKGQAALKALLFKRPEAAKKAGRMIQKNKGIFGSGTAAVAAGREQN